MGKSDYVLIPGGLDLSWSDLHTVYPDDANQCYLVALDNRQLSVLHALVGVTPWYWLWGIDREDVTARQDVLKFKNDLENCLMTGCSVQDLIKVNMMLVAAVTGQPVDLDADPPSGVYSPGGLTPTLQIELQNQSNGINLGFENLTEAVEFLFSKLDDIRAAIEAGDPDSLADELEDITTTISTVAGVLGALV